jgi:hypothetical protein
MPPSPSRESGSVQSSAAIQANPYSVRPVRRLRALRATEVCEENPGEIIAPCASLAQDAGEKRAPNPERQYRTDAETSTVSEAHMASLSDDRDVHAPHPEGLTWADAERSPGAQSRQSLMSAAVDHDMQDVLAPQPEGISWEEAERSPPPAQNQAAPAVGRDVFRLPVSVFYKHYAGQNQNNNCPDWKQLHWLEFNSEDEFRAALYKAGAEPVKVFLGNTKAADTEVRRFTQGVAAFTYENRKIIATVDRVFDNGVWKPKPCDVHLSAVFLRGSHSYVLPPPDSSDIVNPVSRKKTQGT